jgi:Ca-activated chloride channel family protein
MNRSALGRISTRLAVSALLFAAASPAARAELVVDAGNAAVGIPLERQTVRAEISGIVARVSVSQRFRALGAKRAAEAVYRFPLPHDASVHEFRMTIGNREVLGVIERREEARRIYEKAKDRGIAASLLESEAPNVFTMNVANLLPNRPIDVHVVYSQRIGLDDDRYRFRFPLRVGRRNTAEDPDPAHARAVTAHTGFTGFTVDLEVAISPDCALFNLGSPSHEGRLEREGDSAVRLRLAPADPKEDFVLTYDLSSPTRRVVVLPHRPDPASPGYFLLMVVPEKLPRNTYAPKEYLFVLDVSGSMGGEKIMQGKRALEGFIHMLLPQDTFNAYLFAGSSTPFAERSVKATPESIARAVAWLDDANAGGGTNMLQAIEAVLAPESDPQRERVLVLISDGQVSAEPQIVKLVAERMNRGRAFTFAVGDSPNDHLMESLARVGRGTCEYVTNREDLEQKVLRFAERSRRALLRDPVLAWDGLQVDELAPSPTPALYTSRPIVVFGRYVSGGAGTLTISGAGRDGEESERVEVAFPAQTMLNAAVPFLWAGARIRDIMREGSLQRLGEEEVRVAVTRLALAHRLVTEWTSFVAVDNDPLAELIARATAEARRQAIRSYRAAEAARMFAERARTTLGEAKEVLEDARRAAAESRRWSEASKESSERSRHYAEESRKTLEKARELFARVQRGEAVLPPPSGGKMGRVFYTALGVLSLETYYRYLPVYKASPPPARSKLVAAAGTAVGAKRRAVAAAAQPAPQQPKVSVDARVPAAEELADALASMQTAAFGAGGGAFGYRAAGGRRRVVRGGGGSVASSSAVSTTASWMTRAQEADGRWDARRWGATVEADTAVTSLAVLGYLGAGHTEKSGKYRDTVRKGVTWLIAALSAEGAMGEEDHEPVLAHALGTLVLSEAAGMARVPETVAAAQRAVDALLEMGLPFAGWPLRPGGDASDFRTTIWAVMALKSATIAGLKVDGRAFSGAAAYLDRLERDAKGESVDGGAQRPAQAPARHFYDLEPVPQGGRDFGEALPTMMAIVARQFMGWRNSAVAEACRWAAGERPPRWPSPGDADDGMRYFYFGTLASFQVGGEVWRTWNGIARDELIGHMARSDDPDVDGAFDPTLP